MKKLLSLGCVFVSLASLQAADPQSPAASPEPSASPMQCPMNRHHGPMKPGADRWRGKDAKGVCAPGDRKDAKGMNRPMMRHPVLDALQLTPEQKEKAKELLQAAKPQIEAIRADAQAKIQAVMADSFKQLRPMLTPGQQAILDDMQKLQTDKAALKPAKPAADTSTEPAKTE